MDNILFDVDSYKVSHYLQFPPGVRGMFSYLESRGGRYDRTLFFGLQYILEKYLTTRITEAMVIEADKFYKQHGEPFNLDGWMRIANTYNGRFPVWIKAVPEGVMIPTNNVLMSVESTDIQSYWIVSYIETMLMRVWYPITVATQSWHIKRIIKKYLDETSDNPTAELQFKLHDFGARGVSSQESAGIGGMAHLVNFMGTDTVMGVRYADKYYEAGMAGYSIPAAEHSTITAWGKEHEVDAYRNMLKQFAKPSSLVAVVSDSYDLWNAIDKLWGTELRQEVINSGATIIIRPDSGDPPTVVLEALKRLDAKFGHTINSKGYRVLNCVRVIQGDGINEESIKAILDNAVQAGYSATNIAFGMGGALLQKVDRDTQKFAYKCSSILVADQWMDVKKEPITDMGKASKGGRLRLVRNGDQYLTTTAIDKPTLLEDVYLDGEIQHRRNFSDIRHLAESYL